MDRALAKADKEVLVGAVKGAQKLGLRGSSGDWKEFLGSGEKYDPSIRSADVLVAFIKTLTGKEEQIMLKILRGCKSQMTVLRRLREPVDDETPVQRLIRLTIDHPKYRQRYGLSVQNEEWVNIPMGKVSKAMKCNIIIALDCEMVLCEDGLDELVQVCAVDQNLEVKVNMLVKPKKAIVDYRTPITGLSSKDFDGITCSLVDVQKCLKKLLIYGTILAGHGLHNDLQALKIYHPRVIDTSLIFKYANSGHITPSLNNLCKSVLGYELRNEGEPHNCLRDAEAVMKLVLAKMNKHVDDLKDPPASYDYLKRLLLHKIPVAVPYEELHGLFSGKYNVELLGEFRRTVDKYSTFVEFNDPADACEAFHEIDGLFKKEVWLMCLLLDPDTTGRPQKLVSVRLSSGRPISFVVRGSFCNYKALDGGHPECKQLPDSKAVNGDAVEDEINSIVASMKRCIELDRADMPVKRRHVDHEDKDPQEEAEGSGADKHEASPVGVEKEEDCDNDKHGVPSTAKAATPRRCGHAEELDRLMQELKRRDADKMSEIDRLRRLLKEREGEIFDLQKTVYNLTNMG